MRGKGGYRERKEGRGRGDKGGEGRGGEGEGRNIFHECMLPPSLASTAR